MAKTIETRKNIKLSKVARWTSAGIEPLMVAINELTDFTEKPDNKEVIMENVGALLKQHAHILDDESVKSITDAITNVEIEEIYDTIDAWFKEIMNPPISGMQPLRGYQNSNPDFMKPGIIIGYGGKHFDINNLKPEDFSRETQGRCLSRESRYCGNTRLPYTVAQHCVVGAETFLLMGRVDLARIFIRHEGSETILRDMSKPVKDLLPDYEALQARLDKFNAEVHGLPWPFPPEIKILDRNCAQYEMTFMMSTSMHTDYWDPGEAEVRFLETWDKIEHIWNTYYKQPA